MFVKGLRLVPLRLYSPNMALIFPQGSLKSVPKSKSKVKTLEFGVCLVWAAGLETFLARMLIRRVRMGIFP